MKKMILVFMRMRKSIWTILFFSLLLSCNTQPAKERNRQNSTEMEKKNIGKLLALYPKPMTVVGAEVDGKVNWLVVGHTGIIGHDRILVSMSKSHYTNQGIRKSKKLSINLVSRKMLPKADYVGSASGASVDKSNVFEYHWGENGTPVIDASPLTMECDVVDIYETEASTTSSVPSPTLTLLPMYSTLTETRLYTVETRAVRVSDLFLHRHRRDYRQMPELGQAAGMCAKEPMTTDGIVRLSKIEVYPQYLGAYMKYATEVGEVSLRTEPGVLTMYAVGEKENPCKVTILETYASKELMRNILPRNISRNTNRERCTWSSRWCYPTKCRSTR